jgi:hypothetical protein
MGQPAGLLTPARPTAYFTAFWTRLGSKWWRLSTAVAGVFQAVSLGEHPLPAPLPIGPAVLPRQGMGQHHRTPPRRQTLLIEAANN